MYQLVGGCHCGNIRLDIGLSRAPEMYAPRACDCDFCRNHGAAYVSDPKGSLAVRIEDAGKAQRYRQGSGSAECLLCTNCGVYVGAFYRDSDGHEYGTVNVRILGGETRFRAEQVVSPKTLSPEEKAQRWRAIWFPLP